MNEAFSKSPLYEYTSDCKEYSLHLTASLQSDISSDICIPLNICPSISDIAVMTTKKNTVRDIQPWNGEILNATKSEWLSKLKLTTYMTEKEGDEKYKDEPV